MNAPQDQVTLDLLNAIEKNGKSSQRELARNTGVALGLVNSYIKRCVRKGWVKINDAPANRYIYYITPIGFSEKMRLTTRYVSDSFSFYRRASSSSSLMLKSFSDQGYRSIVLFGVSDLAEIVFLKSLESDIEISGIIDLTGQYEQFFSIPVHSKWDSEYQVDAVVLTDILHPDRSFHTARALFGPDKIFVPEILGGWSGKQINAEYQIA